ncbi:MAG: chorismate-binding protein, partial [Methyloceanibacter sp.]
MSSAKASVTPLAKQGSGHPIEPDFPSFARRYDEGVPQVAWTRLVADLETPVSAMLKLAHERANSFLLESVEGGATRGRYSIIGCEPDLIWRADGAKAEINRAPQSDPDAFAPSQLPALASLRALLAESAIALPPELPPMAAGIFGYMGYDTVRLIEHLPGEKHDRLGLPDSILVRPTLIVIFDSVKDEMTVVTPVRPAPGVSAKAAYVRAADRLNLVLERLEQPLPHTSEPDLSAPHPEPKAATEPQAYMAKVKRAKDYIAAGDIFQVVLSQRFEAPFTLPSFALYRALRRVNPSPFLYYLNFGGFAVVGSSPEILVRVRDGKVTIRPIAGTRPRGASPEEDKALAKELLADAKERAEHLMLLDLGRNDVGRVAEVGSVRVTDSFFLEYYSQVIHIVSNVEG